ncbi:MAG: geranylgeranyl reductase family protein [Candidatus Thorarchaeota archaeon]|nr:geranylgeranyl reductase family protein [Candidatus Thorarchaeota archaeon]
MDSSFFDVAVVGAGPAGSSAAAILSRKGFKVALFDRRAKIGVPVQCGELLPTPSEIRDIFPRSKYIPKLVDVRSEFVTNRTSQIMLISPDGHGVEFDFKTNIIDRAKYDSYLVEQACNASCELHLSSLVTGRSSANRLSVKTQSGSKEMQSTIVVGADGPNSLISKTIDNNYADIDRDLSLSLNYVMRGVDCDEEKVLMFFGRNIAPGGYFWIIPKGDSLANVGFGLRRSLSAPHVSLTSHMKHFITKNAIAAPMLRNAKIQSRVGALIPVAGSVDRSYSDSVVLVGDAAGHVMPSNGGGIPQALGDGYIAGHVISSHFEKGTELSFYEKIWRNEFGRQLDVALSVLRIADSVMVSDPLTNVCMRLAGRQFLEPLIRCRLPIPVEFISKTFVRAFNALMN